VAKTRFGFTFATFAEVVEHGAGEADVVDFSLHRVAAAATAVEGEPAFWIKSAAIRIHDNESGLVRLRIHAGEPHHALGISSAAMKRQ